MFPNKNKIMLTITLSLLLGIVSAGNILTDEFLRKVPPTDENTYAHKVHFRTGK